VLLSGRTQYSRLAHNDVMVGSKGETSDVVCSVFSNDQNIMLAIAAGARYPLGQHYHGFHGNDHVWL